MFTITVAICPVTVFEHVVELASTTEEISYSNDPAVPVGTVTVATSPVEVTVWEVPPFIEYVNV